MERVKGCNFQVFVDGKMQNCGDPVYPNTKFCKEHLEYLGTLGGVEAKDGQKNLFDENMDEYVDNGGTDEL